jgi:hypothetical protein
VTGTKDKVARKSSRLGDKKENYPTPFRKEKKTVKY